MILNLLQKYMSAMLDEQEKADTANEARQNPVIRSRMDIDQEDNIIITRGSVTERLAQKEVRCNAGKHIHKNNPIPK